MILHLDDILHPLRVLGKTGGATAYNVQLMFSTADPVLYYLSCYSSITIESVKNGAKIEEIYGNLDRVSVAVEADANTPIKIYGDVTEIYASGSVITDIDVTNCENLVTLGAQGSTFAHIDISQNALLQTLDLLNNSALEDLDYTNNPDLTTLKLSNNTHITAIDVTDKTALTTLVLENMPITTLDLTYNTLLEALSLAGTGITSLDLQTLTALTTLDCSGLPITTLDLTNNPLTSLTCTGCSAVATIYAHATSSDVATAIAALMTANTGLQGTLYTYCNDALYATLATGALAAGWSVVLLDDWLTETTQQAILGAFGQTDGIAVINATNAYLTQLAASDPTKATALAALINEDPMMVCSLGLEPKLTVLPKMPIRFIVCNDRTTYFKSDITYGSNNTIRYKGIRPNIETARGVFSGGFVNGNRCYFIANAGGKMVSSNKSGTYEDSLVISDVVIGSSDIYYVESTIKNGGEYSIRVNSGTISKRNDGLGVIVQGMRMLMFEVYNGTQGETDNTNIVGLEVAVADLDNGTDERHYIPYIHESNYELLDLETFNMAERVGSFGLSYRLPDGTPWTPSTP